MVGSGRPPGRGPWARAGHAHFRETCPVTSGALSEHVYKFKTEQQYPFLQADFMCIYNSEKCSETMLVSRQR